MFHRSPTFSKFVSIVKDYLISAYYSIRHIILLTNQFPSGLCETSSSAPSTSDISLELESSSSSSAWME